MRVLKDVLMMQRQQLELDLLSMQVRVCLGSVVSPTGRNHTTGKANQEIGINPLINYPPMRLLEVVLFLKLPVGEVTTLPTTNFETIGRLKPKMKQRKIGLSISRSEKIEKMDGWRRLF